MLPVLTAPPRSYEVSDDELAEMGFPVKLVSKIVGTPVVIREGDRRMVAETKAALAGKIRLAFDQNRLDFPTWAEYARAFGLAPELPKFNREIHAALVEMSQ